MSKKRNDTSNSDIAQIITEKSGQEIKRKLQDLLSRLDGELVNDDDVYSLRVISVIKSEVEASVKDINQLMPDFDNKFESAMLNLRDELIVTNDFSLDLARNFDERLSEILTVGFEQVIEPA